MKRSLFIPIAVAFLLAACGGGTSTVSPSTGGKFPNPPSASLTGAGATFPAPFYSAAFDAFNQKWNQVKVNYQPIGSGNGIKELTKKTVDFGASDVPLKDSEAALMGGREAVVQIPATLGTVSLAYNLDSVPTGTLKLTPDLIAAIFLGKIKKWNDPLLVAKNSGVNLPNATITPVHRIDGSGTTYIFTDYLSTVSPDWKAQVGKGKTVPWPAVGQGAPKNEGVAATVKQTPGAIGYVELAYVMATQMSQASLQNADGNFVIPSPEGATAAAKSKPNVTPTDFSIVNAPGKDSAPISGYSWAMIYKDQPDKTKGTAMVDLFYWLLSDDGQQYAEQLHYAKLPPDIVQSAIAALKTVSYQGTPLLSVP